MEWKNWECVPFSNRNLLPSYSGIYVVADASDFVWYVGQAANLKNRWLGRSHHRYPQLTRANRKLGHKIYWQAFPPSQLNEREQFYINLFKPELNGCKVKTYLPKQPQVDREIKRLLKVLNKSTALFPIIRSVIVGEYEDEDGTRCILTATNLNDFRVLGNSATKRHATEVRKAWIDFKSYCGKSEEHYDCRWIPAYSLKGQRFEFIEGCELLRYLEENPDAFSQFLDVVELFGVEVKVLKDLSILNSISLDDEYNFISNGRKTLKDAAYLNYRKQVLQPIVR